MWIWKRIRSKRNPLTKPTRERPDGAQIIPVHRNSRKVTQTVQRGFMNILCLFSIYIVSGHRVLGVFSVIISGTMSTITLVYLASLFQWSYALSVVMAMGKRMSNLWWSVGDHICVFLTRFLIYQVWECLWLTYCQDWYTGLLTAMAVLTKL